MHGRRCRPSGGDRRRSERALDFSGAGLQRSRRRACVPSLLVSHPPGTVARLPNNFSAARRLCGPQSTRRFEGSWVPPHANGWMWSIWRSNVELHRRPSGPTNVHRSPSRSMTASRTARGMCREAGEADVSGGEGGAASGGRAVSGGRAASGGGDDAGSGEVGVSGGAQGDACAPVSRESDRPSAREGDGTHVDVYRSEVSASETTDVGEGVGGAVGVGSCDCGGIGGAIGVGGVGAGDVGIRDDGGGDMGADDVPRAPCSRASNSADAFCPRGADPRCFGPFAFR